MIITDSVCLKLLDDDTLLVAVGNSLVVHHRSSKSPPLHFENLLPERIHGIASQPIDRHHRIVCFGGRFIVQLTLDRQSADRSQPLVRHSQAIRLSDWIGTVHLLPSTDELLLLTGHGTAIRLRLAWSAPFEAAIVHSLRCPDNTTLYCSQILASPPGVVFLGGTAFGQLLVWQSNGVVGRHTCHNGVLFAIECDRGQRLLCTASDDRSVRVWSLNDDDAGWSFGLLHSLFAHGGRVFRCRLLDNALLLSAGEDGQLCVWNARSGRLLGRQSFGAQALWHIEYDFRRRWALLAAADGQPKQFDVGALLDGDYAPSGFDATSLGLPAGEHVARVRFVGANGSHLACVTNRNRLLCGHFDGDSAWQTLHSETVPFDVKAIERNAGLDLLALAGNRTVRVYRCSDRQPFVEQLLEREFHFERLQTMKFIAAKDEIGVGGTAELLISDCSGTAHVLTTDDRLSGPIAMLKCREPFATVAYRPRRDLLLIGDRCGNLQLLASEGAEVRSLCGLWAVHDRLAGCSTLTGDAAQRQSMVVLSGGNDGRLRRIRIDEPHDSSEKWRLDADLSLQVPMTSIEAMDCGGRLLLGYDSNRCIVWNRKCRRVLASFDCGGRHRDSDALLSAGRFVYLRSRTLQRVRFDGRTDGFWVPDEQRWHRLSCTVAQTTRMADGGRLIVSGGDDNTLMFHTAQTDGRMRLKHFGDVHSHVSSVRALCVFGRLGGWRVVSAGGRAQLCVTDVRPDADGLLSVREAGQFMLHRTDAERGRRSKDRCAEAEARFLGVDRLTAEGDWLIVAGSDGRLRSVRVTDEGRIEVCGSTDVGRCVMQVRTLRRRAADGSRRAVFASLATDGRVCFWRWTEGGDLPREPFAEIEHHAGCGAAGMDALELFGGERFALATGGDDQSVCVSTFRLADDAGLSEVRTQRLLRHTAQVTGVRFGEIRPTDERLRLYSTGTDQTVMRWECDRTGDGGWRTEDGKCKPEWLAVADVKGLLVWTEEDLDEGLVFGNGVQSFCGGA